MLERKSFHGAALALLLAAANARMLRADFFPAHDGAWLYYVFHLFYNEMALFHELPRWFAFGFGGVQTDFYQTLLSPAQLFLILLAPLLPFKTTLAPYYLSMLLEQALFVAGAYALAGRLCARPLARLLVAIGCVCTILWETQASNFRSYFWAPFWLYFLDRFAEERQAWPLWTALLFLLVSMLGNAAYMAPVFGALVLALAAGSVGSSEVRPWSLRGLRLASPRSLFALALLALGAAVYRFFLGHASDWVMNYAPGRDPRTLAAPLEIFLTYDRPAVRQFWELLYGAPHDFDFNITFYVGWIPLALLGAQLSRWPHGRRARALWLGAALLSLFSVANVSFVAPLLYDAFPMIKYYRHLHFVLPIVKLLLLLLAGVALDELLVEGALLEGRLRALRDAGLALLAGVAAVDVLWLRGGLPYPIQYPTAYLVPYAQFHLVPMAVLAVLLLRLSSPERLSGTALGRWIVGCYLVEILSYHSFVTLAAPARLASVPPETFAVRPYAFAAQRLPDRALAPRPVPAAAAALLGRWGAPNALADAFLGVDVCDQALRLDVLNRGLDRMIRARVGVALDDPSVELPGSATAPRHFAPIPPPADVSLQRSNGCLWPKLRLVGKTIVAKDLDDAARLVRLSRELESSAILPPLGPAAALPRASSGLPGAVSVRAFRSNHLTVEADVKAKSGAWLIYADGYNPAWTAAVDGRPTGVVEANLGFKGVRLPAGRSLVELDYAGGANRLPGLFLAAFGALGFLAACLWAGAALAAL